MDPHWHWHRAFGLTVRSSLPLPELIEQPAAGAADVEVLEGHVPEELADAQITGIRFQAAPGRLLLKVDNVANFLIRDGRRIIFERIAGAEDDEVRLFLLGSAFGAMLHERKDLVLHGSAIAVNGSAAVFLGRSGIGKSTLAMAFAKRGYPVLTDDLSVLRPDESGALSVQPGFPQVKLWCDSLEKLSIDATELRRVRAKLEKRALPLNGTYKTEPLPVKRIYVIRATNKDELSVTPLTGPQKFMVLKSQTYRFQFVDGLGAKPAHFGQAMALANQASISVIVRPQAPFRLEELATQLETDFAA